MESVSGNGVPESDDGRKELVSYLVGCFEPTQPQWIVVFVCLSSGIGHQEFRLLISCGSSALFRVGICIRLSTISLWLHIQGNMV